MRRISRLRTTHASTASKRTTAAFAFGLSLAFGLATAPAAAKEAAKTPKNADAEPPFIAETRIVAPRRVGDFALEQTRYDAKNKYGGVALRYAHADHPEIRIDLFVYPAGDIPVERALKTELGNFQESLQGGVKLGYFSDLRVLGVDEFAIRPEPAAATADTPQPRPAGDASLPGDVRHEAHVEMTLAETIPADTAPPLPGKRLRLRYVFADPESGERHPMRSRGYLAYRQLYYFKARITAAESQIAEDRFSAVADRAMRTLTLAVQAYNIGACGEVTVTLDAALLSAGPVDIGDGLTRYFDEAQATADARNCRPKLDEKEWAKVSADAFVETITFNADDWNGAP